MAFAGITDANGQQEDLSPRGLGGESHVSVQGAMTCLMRIRQLTEACSSISLTTLICQSLIEGCVHSLVSSLTSYLLCIKVELPLLRVICIAGDI